MKDFSRTTKFYLLSIMLSGTLLLAWNLQYFRVDNWPALLALMALGSLVMIIKVDGATGRWHITANFLVYGFCILSLSLASTMLVILVSNIAYWLWHRSEYKNKWYINPFNIAGYCIVTQAAALVYNALNPSGGLQDWVTIPAILVAMITFTLLNHLIIGIIVWLARGENFTQSGVFNTMPLAIDLTLLVMGASLNIVWDYNPSAILLFLIPLYLIYSTLRVPMLERQTELDAKTGLFNHAYFMQQLENELARANRFDRPLTIILGDLDLLRDINNTYGHLAGDEVIKGVATVMKQCVREYDVVARFGGEEFSILLPETSVTTAYERAEKIRTSVALAEFTVPTSVNPIQVTISFGIAGRENITQTKEEIVHNADTALYRSKLKGRNRTHIYAFDEYPSQAPDENPSTAEASPAAGEYAAATTHYQVNKTPQPEADTTPEASPTSPIEPEPIPVSDPRPETNTAKLHVNTFIGLVVTAAVVLFFLNFQPLNANELWGLALFTGIVALTEWFSINLYVRETAISTTAAPLMAGTLLFGPFGALVLCVTFALTAYLKFRGPFSRTLFNASNQLIAAALYLSLLRWWVTPFLEYPILLQLIFAILATAIVYLVTTALVAIGMGLAAGDLSYRIWKEQFSWLGPYYLVLGLIAYALVFGYHTANVLGVIVVLAPLFMLRYSQAQYIERTRQIVVELREKNARLENSSREISAINNGLLDTLAEVIDLRDKFVLSHSQRVTQYAVSIARGMRLNPKQVELVRKASLLHDIGKVGIPDAILGKPARLTSDEFQTIQKHPEFGASLLEASPSLRGLIPSVKHHHEHFDGQGYPEGLKENQIPLEARIVAVADAIEAMSSDRPYRKMQSTNYIIAELKKCSGTQFDPQVVEIAIRIIQAEGKSEPPS